MRSDEWAHNHKVQAIKGQSGKSGWDARKANALIWGDLSPSRTSGNPACESRLRRQGSAEAIVPAPVTGWGRAERQEWMDLSSSRDEQGRPPVRTTDTAGKPKPVKPAGAPGRAEPSPARDETPSNAEAGSVWEQVFARANLFAALDRVEKNAGAPGSDGLRVDELRSYLKDH